LSTKPIELAGRSVEPNPFSSGPVHRNLRRAAPPQKAARRLVPVAVATLMAARHASTPTCDGLLSSARPGMSLRALRYPQRSHAKDLQAVPLLQDRYVGRIARLGQPSRSNGRAEVASLSDFCRWSNVHSTFKWSEGQFALTVKNFYSAIRRRRAPSSKPSAVAQSFRLTPQS
jgi:hypothetical protein